MPPADRKTFIVKQVLEVLESHNLKPKRDGEEVTVAIPMRCWDPPFDLALSWSADAGAVAVIASIAGLSTGGRPNSEINEAFAAFAPSPRPLLDEMMEMQSAEGAQIVLKAASLMGDGPRIDDDGVVRY